jgi:SOS-response transcriptional repressor LexA
MNVKDIRRFNLRRLAEEIGGITALAKNLGKSQSQISHLIGTRPIKNIGDKLAAEIEKAFNKSAGWLDREHYFVAEERGIYVIDNQEYRPLCWAPIIEWREIMSWSSKQKELKEKAKSYVPIQADRKSNLFALRANEHATNTLENYKINLPPDTILVVDPTQKMKNGSYGLVTMSGKPEPVLGIYEEVSGKSMFKPLNTTEAAVETSHGMQFIGIVKQMLLNLP